MDQHWQGRQCKSVFKAIPEKDLNVFINCGVQDMALGGVLFLCMTGRLDTWTPAQQVSVGGKFYVRDFEDARHELVTHE